MNMTVCPRCGCPVVGPRCRRCMGLVPRFVPRNGGGGLGGGLGASKRKAQAQADGKGLPTWAVALMAFGGIVLIGGGLYWLKTRKRRK